MKVNQLGVGPLVRIKTLTCKQHYVNILQNNLPFLVNSIGLGKHKVVFQQDGDARHIGKVVKTWLENQKLSVIKSGHESDREFVVHCEKNWQRMIIHPLGFMNCGREQNRNGTISDQKLLKI